MRNKFKDFGYSITGNIAFKHNGYSWVCIENPKIAISDGRSRVDGDRLYYSNFKSIIKLIITGLLASKTEKKENIKELISSVLFVGKEIRRVHEELSESIEELKGMVKSESDIRDNVRSELINEYKKCKKCKFNKEATQ